MKPDQEYPLEPIEQEEGQDDRNLSLAELLAKYGLTAIETPDGHTLYVNADGTPLTPIHLLWRQLSSKS